MIDRGLQAGLQPTFFLRVGVAIRVGGTSPSLVNELLQNTTSAVVEVTECNAIMSIVYIISAARPDDLPLLPSIELAAAKLLIGHAPESVLGETTSQDDLRRAQRQGLLWVALANNVPVGFAHVDVIEPSSAHLKEIDVHPQHGRRGLGTRLVLNVCAWAAMAGYQTVTLTTFRDVEWNMPFYARLGFREIPADQLSEVLLSILRDETRRGLDPARRVAMERLCLLPVGAMHL